MAVVMIGVDPHKASHTAVAISAAEERLGQRGVRASADQAQRLLAWAAGWPERTWAVEGADGVGHLLERLQAHREHLWHGAGLPQPGLDVCRYRHEVRLTVGALSSAIA